MVRSSECICTYVLAAGVGLQSSCKNGCTVSLPRAIVSLFETWECDLVAYIPGLILLELGRHVSKVPDSVYN